MLALTYPWLTYTLRIAYPVTLSGIKMFQSIELLYMAYLIYSARHPAFHKKIEGQSSVIVAEPRIF